MVTSSIKRKSFIKKKKYQFLYVFLPFMLSHLWNALQLHYKTHCSTRPGSWGPLGTLKDLWHMPKLQPWRVFMLPHGAPSEWGNSLGEDRGGRFPVMGMSLELRRAVPDQAINWSYCHCLVQMHHTTFKIPLLLPQGVLLHAIQADVREGLQSPGKHKILVGFLDVGLPHCLCHTQLNTCSSCLFFQTHLTPPALLFATWLFKVSLSQGYKDLNHSTVLAHSLHEHRLMLLVSLLSSWQHCAYRGQNPGMVALVPKSYKTRR